MGVATDSIKRDAIAIGLATGVYAISYGVLAVAAGLTVAQTCAMSILVFTGASQFAVVGVISAGGGMLAAMAPALVLAARNSLYGLSLVPILRGRPLTRAAQSQLVIDESTAMARAQPERAAAQRAFLATGVSVFVFWNLGTLAGALLGGGLGDPRALGLDAMFPAAFLALLAPQLRRPEARSAAICGALLAVALVPFTPVGSRSWRRCLGSCPGYGFCGGRGGHGMSWTAILLLGAAAYAMKALGPVMAGGRMVRPDLAPTLELLAVPLLAALVLVQTLDSGGRLVIDARVPALCVAALLVWRRAPFVVVVLAAAATAALLRAVA